VQQQRDEAGPAGLMRRTDATPGIAVEVLVEQHVVPEARGVLVQRAVVEAGPVSDFPYRDNRRFVAVCLLLLRPSLS
jgi:hypothetical protein